MRAGQCELRIIPRGSAEHGGGRRCRGDGWNGRQAASTAAFASNVEELAEYVEFELNGEPIRGWVWRSPFREGDVVDVAAEWQDDHYEAYGIARPSDKMIALYPHCSRSTERHIRNAAKWWVIWNAGYFGFTAALTILLLGVEMLREPVFFWLNGAIAIVFILMFFSLAKQYMPFGRVAEKIFTVLDLPNPRKVDLVHSSKAQRTLDDAPEYGTFYFRY